MSAAPDFSATSATVSLNFTKSGFLVTKSVSQLTSTSTAAPSFWAATMRPSAATRLAFLSALARPDLRSHSMATSMSPLFSTSAFLHSIMPAPERSRSSLTSCAEILLILDPSNLGAPWRASRHGSVKGLLGGLGLLATAATAAAVTTRRAGALLGRTAVVALATGRGGFALVLGDRVAFLVQLDELVGVAMGGVRSGGLAFQDRVGGGAGVQLDGADGVVVARDGVVHQLRVVVGVNDRDYRDAELLGFLHGDVLMADVDHEQRVGQAVHVLDAAQRILELVALAAQRQHLVLDQLVEGAVGLGRFQLLQARDRLLDGAEVGQHATQPAGGDVRHAGAGGLFGQRLAGRALGADEQDGAALLRQARQEVHRVGEQRQGLLEVDDVDLAARAEDVRRHLRVPVAGLVTEMHASFKHLAHGDLCHGGVLDCWAAKQATRGLGPPRIPGFDHGRLERRAAAPRRRCRYVCGVGWAWHRVGATIPFRLAPWTFS